jgi:hypothetical protein
MTIMILIELVKKFKNCEVQRIPRFFDATGLFRSAVREAGIESFLYEADDQKHVNVLRDADYFIFKSVFRPQQEHSSVRVFSDIDLEKLYKQISDIVEAQKPLPQTLEVSGRPLHQIISEFRGLLFFEHVWLRSYAEEDVKQAAEELGEAVRQLDSEEFQQGVEAAIEAAKEALGENVREYKSISTLWTQFERPVQALRRRVVEMSQSLDIFRDFRLFRFAFPPEFHERIRKVLDGLLSNPDENEEKEALISVITAYNDGDNTGNLGDVIVVVATLWVTEMYAQLIKFLQRKNTPKQYSLDIALAAAIFETKQDVEQGYDVVKKLEKIFSNTTDSRERADLAVGIAYLYFHLWSCRGFSASWRTRPPLLLKEATSTGSMLINKALYYAQEASESSDVDNMKKVYAFNQYLYYLVEGGSDDQIKNMDDAAGKLIACKDQFHGLWTYAYDDTLARYYHRKALLTKEKRQLEAALDYSNEAEKKGYGDERVKQYRKVIEYTFATLFRESEIS